MAHQARGIDGLVKDLRSSLDSAVSFYENRLADLLDSPAFKYPMEAIERREQELDDLGRSRENHFAHGIEIRAERMKALSGKLHALSPLAILMRGYSITLAMPGGRLLRDVKGIKRGDTIETKLAGGRIVSEVKDIVKEEIR